MGEKNCKIHVYIDRPTTLYVVAIDPGVFITDPTLFFKLNEHDRQETEAMHPKCILIFSKTNYYSNQPREIVIF